MREYLIFTVCMFVVACYFSQDKKVSNHERKHKSVVLTSIKEKGIVIRKSIETGNISCGSGTGEVLLQTDSDVVTIHIPCNIFNYISDGDTIL